MDAIAARLRRKYGITGIQARALVAAGYMYPRQIINATLEELEAVRTIGSATAAKLKGL